MRDVDVFKHVERYGYEFKSGKSQVVVHGRNLENNFGEVALVVRNKHTLKWALVLFDLKVELVPHLGLHKCTRKNTTTVIKFEDLISSVPLNLYTSKDSERKDFSYVSLKESLVYD
jgi:hypothetical protein